MLSSIPTVPTVVCWTALCVLSPPTLVSPLLLSASAVAGT